jgi:hypothetical protein
MAFLLRLVISQMATVANHGLRDEFGKLKRSIDIWL